MTFTNEDVQEVLETPETEAEPDNTEVESEETQDDDIEAIKKKAEDLEKKNRQLYERLKKQEKTVPSETSGLAPKDLLALTKADISVDDFDEVQDYARYKNISIAEALSHNTLKSILAERAEERRTAQATQTRSARTTAKNTGEDLLRKAQTTGEVPTTDEGLMALAKARLERKRRS